MIELGLIFSAAKTVAGLGKSVARLLGIVQSLETKLDRLISAELNAGFRNLEQACNSDNEMEPLLREARNCFVKATALETGCRKGIALLGLAVCHYHLEDYANYHAALEELVSLPPAIGEWSVVASALRKRIPGSPYESMMRLLSANARRAKEQERIAYMKGIVMSAVLRSDEAKALLELQEEAGKVINKPVKWREDLEAGRFSLPPNPA